MRLTYDPRYNIAYLYLKERPVEVETIKVSEELNVDIAPDGTIYGIELLNANEQLAGIDTGKLRVINNATGKQIEVPLELSA
ncbi:MAG: DUF2283 domain-containing protein [Candidatus Bipolaricaulota bacterium]|nr:DUF2283 domain-containing protein [Candidatus Bipolaricaulota bacterium]